MKRCSIIRTRILTAICSAQLVTPGKGTLTLSREDNPELFDMAKCGLGCLGIVAEVTLQVSMSEAKPTNQHCIIFVK
jgi:hypothetical protein